MCTVNAVCGRLDVNVALNRPAFMSSVYNVTSTGWYFGPWKANDGNRDPIAKKVDNSCVHTLNDGTYHWWAVDLGVPLYVAGILFTNRAEGRGNVHEYIVTNLGHL